MKKTLLKTLLTSIGVLLMTTSVFAGPLEDKIVGTLRNAGSEIDVTSFNLTPQAAMDKYLDVVAQNPDLFYVKNHVECKYDKSTGLCTALVCSYNTSDIAGQKAVFDAEINKIAAIPGQTTFDKVKAAHDYIVTNYEYDQSGTAITPYEMIMSKKGVCTGYTGMFKAVMTKLGIPCEVAISSDMQHEWCTVKVDGSWYNIDLTWDDPIGGGSNITYANFLKSDKIMGISGHYNWTTPSKAMCADTKYDTMG